MAGTTSTIPITVGGTIVQFPNNGASPQWSPAIIKFAQLVSTQLQTLSSPYDIAPSVDTLSTNPVSNQLLGGGNVSFPNGVVRSFVLTYAIYCSTSTTKVASSGTFSGVYNTGTGLWNTQHEMFGERQSTGIPYESFDINSSNQIQLSVASIPGVYSTGTISYSAKTELVV
jgi:hypothetical protein